MKKKYLSAFIIVFLSAPYITRGQVSDLRSDSINILKYTINLNITDFVTKIIKGNTEIKFTPKVNGINILNLDLLMMTVDSVQMGSTDLVSSYNDTLLQIHLPSLYNINDTGNVTVFYHGSPQGDASGWGGFYFQGNYAYNMGVGFDALPHNYGRVWYPCFDNFTERASYEFNITTNDGKIDYSNGFLASDTTDGSGNRTRKWIMNEQIPSYLACVAIANYTEINQTYTGISGTIPIVIAAMAADTNHVKSSFVNLSLALSTFENHFGPYRWNKVGYNMVPFTAGAMEHATNITYPMFAADGSISYQTLYVHELSHHWFGDLATCRTAKDMWLNEGWAHYCEALFTEAYSGYSSYISWVRGNHSENLQFLQHKEGGYLTLSDIPLTYTYGDHVYNKGADVAHTMRGYMGDSLFYYAVKTYLSNNQYKDVLSADFRDALTAASGIDMNSFFNDWVFNPGWPHFSIDSSIVIPSDSNYNVTVFVKQKLTGAPNYFGNVPLEITFKAADFTEQTQTFMMSGSGASFSFTAPFRPAFIAVNMGEKISHAVAPDYKKIIAAGSQNFSNAKMSLYVQEITDSAFIRIEHNFAAPDPFKTCCIPYRLSPNHYWKVDGVLPSTFKAKATVNYEGRTLDYSGSYWLDNDLINNYEDSLVLMYRKNAAEEWHVYPYFSKNYVGSNNDKHGIITIDTLQLGEYVFAMKDYALGIHTASTAPKKVLAIFPNPAKEYITIDVFGSFGKTLENSIITITDLSGKMVYKEKLQEQRTININTASFKNGVYSVCIKLNDELIAGNKFVVTH